MKVFNTLAVWAAVAVVAGGGFAAWGAGGTRGSAATAARGATSVPAARGSASGAVERGPEAATGSVTTRGAERLMDPVQIAKLPAGGAYAEAVKYLAAGDQRGAEDIFKTLQGKYPRDQQIVLAWAILTRSRFDVLEAAPIFERAMGLAPQSVMGQAALWMLKIDARQDAEVSFAKLVAQGQQPGASPMILWLGGIAGRTLDKNAEGADCYRALLKQWDPGPSLVHQTFANVLDELGRYDEALEHRLLAVQQEPTGWSYQGLGNTYFHLKKVSEAQVAFVKAVELDPKSRYWFDWANLLLRVRHYDEAIETCKKGLEVMPNDAWGLDIWGESLAGKGMMAEALAKFQEAIKADGDYVQGYKDAATTAEQLKDGKQAIDYRKVVVAKQPTGATYRELGNLYQRLGQFEEAAKSYEKGAELLPKNANILADWADALRLQRKLEESLVKCRESVAANPANAHSWIAWAYTLEEQGKNEEAVATLQKGTATVVTDQRYLYQEMAQVLDRMGKKEDAAAARKKFDELSAGEKK